MSRSAMALRLTGGFGLAALLLCAFTPLANVAAHRLAEPTATVKAGAIVVLGAGVRSDGSLGDSSLRRAVKGIEVFHRGGVPLLLFTGSSTAGPFKEATQRQHLAEQLAVPEGAIVLEEEALTTREEVRRSVAILRERAIDSIIVVTDSLHAYRARREFQREGFVVGVETADSMDLDAGTPEARLLLTKAVAQQAAALLYYRLTG